MAIELNDNIYSKVNRPTDFRFGPFISIAQANSIIPIAQRYHGLLFGVYTDPGNIATSDIIFYYYWDGLTNSDVRILNYISVPYIGAIQNVDLGNNDIKADAFIVNSGTSAQFLKADGTLDSNSYYLASNPSAFITLTSLSAGIGISYNNTTGAISSTITQYTDSNARAALSFTAGSGGYNNTTGVITIPTNTNQLTNGASYITLGSLSANTGISYNNTTGVITNSAPDQTVAFINGTGISVTGTYPNFTVTNTAPSSGGTVTSVAALTLGTAGTNLSSTVATGTTTPVITLNVPTASATNRGALSSTDWSTFNGKIGGTIETGQVAFGTGINTIGGENTLFWNSTTNRLGINDSTPSYPLDINGSGEAAVIGVKSPLNITSDATTRLRIDSTQAVPNAGVGLYAGGVAKFSFAMYGATNDFTIYNDSLSTTSILIKGDTNNLLVSTTVDGGQKFQVAGTVAIRASATATTASTFPVFISDPSSTTTQIFTRTAAQVVTDLGLSTNYVTIATAQTITGAKIFNNALLVLSENNPILRIASTSNTGTLNFRNVSGEDKAGIILDNPANKFSIVTRVSNADIEIAPNGTGSILLPNVPSGTGNILMLNASNELVKGGVTGTFIPTLTDSSGAETYTFTVLNASYNKIGNIVHISLFLTGITSTSGTPSGTPIFQIGGLPFTSGTWVNSTAQCFSCSAFKGSSVSSADVALLTPYADAVNKIVFRNKNTAALVGDVTFTSGILILTGYYSET